MKFKDAIKEIENRLSIVDVIGEYVRLSKKGSSYVGLCPFHNDHNPSFSVSESRKIYKCFVCENAGNVFTFLQRYLNMSFREAVLMLAEKANIEIEDDYTSNEIYKKSQEQKEKLYELYKDVANTYYKILFSDIGKPGLDYIKSRNLSKETIKKFGLGFAPNSYGYVYKLMKDKGYDDQLLLNESKLFRLHNDSPVDVFYNRVMFPLVDINKHVIGFQSRSLEPKPNERKYVNSEDTLIFHKKSFLYAMNYAFYSKENYYILCEGNMDAITIHQSGFDNAIATMGTAFNEQQMYLLKRKPKKIYLCQDTDDAGVNAIIRSNKILRDSGFETYVLDLKPLKDVDEFINKFGVDEFKKKLENPIPAFLFIISTLKNKYNLSDPYEYENYLNEIIEKLAEFSNNIVRDSYLKKVALQENLDAGTLRKMLDEYLKGNKIELSKGEENIKNLNNIELSKLDTNFINIIFNQPNLKEKIRKIISPDELYNSIYEYLYNLYLDGNEISDVYNKINDKSDDEKNAINKILMFDYNYDNDQAIIDSLNQIIRQIKIRTANNKSSKNLDSVFELNKKIIEINKTTYI